MISAETTLLRSLTAGGERATSLLPKTCSNKGARPSAPHTARPQGPIWDWRGSEGGGEGIQTSHTCSLTPEQPQASGATWQLSGSQKDWWGWSSREHRWFIFRIMFSTLIRSRETSKRSWNCDKVPREPDLPIPGEPGCSWWLIHPPSKASTSKRRKSTKRDDSFRRNILNNNVTNPQKLQPAKVLLQEEDKRKNTCSYRWKSENPATFWPCLKVI